MWIHLTDGEDSNCFGNVWVWVTLGVDEEGDQHDRDSASNDATYDDYDGVCLPKGSIGYVLRND